MIQQGTHAELVADENGKYYELWNAAGTILHRITTKMPLSNRFVPSDRGFWFVLFSCPYRIGYVLGI